MPPHNFTPKCLCLDIETAVSDVFEIHKLAAWRPDTGKSLSLNGRNLAASAAQFDQLTDGAAFVLGHKVRRHDLPVLIKLFPDLGLHALPVVDTLELSPVYAKPAAKVTSRPAVAVVSGSVQGRIG
jgi:ATP-dependent DNA helicase RecQ